MRKNLMSKLASLACCLVLAVPGIAAERLSQHPEELFHIPPTWVSMKGRLVRTVVYEEVPRVGPGPHTTDIRYRERVVWTLHVGDNQYEVVFNDKLVAEEAERLQGRMVLASGLAMNLMIRLDALAAVPATTMTGKLTSELLYIEEPKHGPGPHTMEARLKEIRQVWKLTMPDGRAYILNLPTRELRDQAAALEDHTVTVAGAIGDAELLVDSMRPAPIGSIRQTVEVELVGDVSNLGEYVGPGEKVYYLRVDDKMYLLRKHSKEKFDWEAFAGRRVHVTGVLEGDTVIASSIKEQGNHSIKTTVKVEIVGWLRVEEMANAVRSWEVWEVTAAGKTYRLKFATPGLAQKARGLMGTEVVITGTLEDGVVKVTDIQPKISRPDDRAEW
jgi:hypothetical protein